MGYSYKTKVRINPSVIAESLEILRGEYEVADPTGNLRKSRKADNLYGAEEARSKFSRWNNLNHFYERLLQRESPKDNIPILETRPDGSVVIEVEGHAEGNSARVYFKPSITSLDKSLRKAILPLTDGNVFISFDLRAAEFALRCVQAGETAALEDYSSGEDIYMHFADLFPIGSERKVIKTCLIANMYGQTAYKVGQTFGISDTQAQRILDSVARSTPRLTMLKSHIVRYDRAHGGYFSPRGLSGEMVKVADFTPATFNENLAWSAWTQSALGFMMQDFTTEFERHQGSVVATHLSVFDSFIAEISPESINRFKEWATAWWSPLLPDEFGVGSSMYESMYGSQN